jgi:hypothetical protein
MRSLCGSIQKRIAVIGLLVVQARTGEERGH